MDDVSRPEVSQLRERLFIEHGCRTLPTTRAMARNRDPHFRSAIATLENVGIDLVRPGTRRKTPSEHLEPLGTDPALTDEEIYQPSNKSLIDITRLPAAHNHTSRPSLGALGNVRQPKL